MVYELADLEKRVTEVERRMEGELRFMGTMIWCKYTIDRILARERVHWPKENPDDVLWDANLPIPSRFNRDELQTIQKFIGVVACLMNTQER